MISGRWGIPTEVLLDLVVDDHGEVRGIVNPGRQNAAIQSGFFDSTTGAVHLDGEHVDDEGVQRAFHIEGRLERRRLRLTFQFGERRGQIDVVRVEEYRPRALTWNDRVRPYIANIVRWMRARSRPSGARNAQRLRERGESLDSLVLRDAQINDVPALAALHVTTWNATYRTSRGPTIATREAQWRETFQRSDRRDFILVLEDASGRLVGFTSGRPSAERGEGEISKIYLRWEYHGLGLGRRMMTEAARRFAAQGTRSIVLCADLANPTLGFYERLGGVRVVDERGRFHGAYRWRDLSVLIS